MKTIKNLLGWFAAWFLIAFVMNVIFHPSPIHLLILSVPAVLVIGGVISWVGQRARSE